MKKNRRSARNITVVEKQTQEERPPMQISTEQNIGEDGWAEPTTPDNPIFALQRLARTMVGYSKAEHFLPPMTSGKPKDGPGKEAVMAQDADWSTTSVSMLGSLGGIGVYAGTQRFIGYPALSILAQDGLIRSGCENLADDMTRKWVSFIGESSQKENIKKIEDWYKDNNVRYLFNKLAKWTQYFGGGMLYIDMGDLTDEQLMNPLVLDKDTFDAKSFRGFNPVEPIMVYPGTYNTLNPIASDYFEPNYYYVLGKQIHRTRFLKFIDNEAPYLLKPSYNFFGIPMAQIALDYIAHFIRNREDAQRVLNKFSLTAIKTDMSGVLTASKGALSNVQRRVGIIAKNRTNNDIVVLDKDREDMIQINTPLSGISDIVNMSQNLIPAIFRQTVSKFYGVPSKGYNIKEDVSIRNYYDLVSSKMETIFGDNLKKVLKIAKLCCGVEGDITQEFNPLWEMDASEAANIKKVNAEVTSILVTMGIVSREEAREKIGKDPMSGFLGIDPKKIPESPAGGVGAGLIQPRDPKGHFFKIKPDENAEKPNENE